MKKKKPDKFYRNQMLIVRKDNSQDNYQVKITGWREFETT